MRIKTRTTITIAMIRRLRAQPHSVSGCCSPNFGIDNAGLYCVVKVSGKVHLRNRNSATNRTTHQGKPKISIVVVLLVVLPAVVPVLPVLPVMLPAPAVVPVVVPPAVRPGDQLAPLPAPIEPPAAVVVLAAVVPVPPVPPPVVQLTLQPPPGGAPFVADAVTGGFTEHSACACAALETCIMTSPFEVAYASASWKLANC